MSSRIILVHSFIFVLLFFLCLTYQLFAQELTSEDLMAMSLEELLDIEIITAGKKSEKVSDVPASVVVIRREEVETYGYSSLKEIIDDVTGYYTIDDRSYNHCAPGVRGYWSSATKSVMILINGIPQVQVERDAYKLKTDSLPVEAIDRIEVIRGPMGVIYGTGAFFGVINIITDETSEGISNTSSQLNSDMSSIKNISDEQYSPG